MLSISNCLGGKPKPLNVVSFIWLTPHPKSYSIRIHVVRTPLVISHLIKEWPNRLYWLITFASIMPKHLIHSNLSSAFDIAISRLLTLFRGSQVHKIWNRSWPTWNNNGWGERAGIDWWSAIWTTEYSRSKRWLILRWLQNNSNCEASRFDQIFSLITSKI